MICTLGTARSWTPQRASSQLCTRRRHAELSSGNSNHTVRDVSDVRCRPLTERARPPPVYIPRSSAELNDEHAFYKIKDTLHFQKRLKKTLPFLPGMQVLHSFKSVPDPMGAKLYLTFAWFSFAVLSVSLRPSPTWPLGSAVLWAAHALLPLRSALLVFLPSISKSFLHILFIT